MVFLWIFGGFLQDFLKHLRLPFNLLSMDLRYIFVGFSIYVREVFDRCSQDFESVSEGDFKRCPIDVR